jgi:hypothetical protein
MTMISINKDTINRRPVDVALLAAGTASHVWFEDEIKSEKKETDAFRLAAKRKARLLKADA